MQEVNVAKKKMMLPFVITVVCSVLFLLTVFLPYATAKPEHKAWLREHAELDYVEEIGMTNGEAVDLSLVEFMRIYAEAIRQDMQKEISIACIVIIAIFTGLSVITLLLALFKKPIGVMVFDVLAMVAFRIIHFDFEDRGVIPSSSYDWGITNTLVYVFGVCVLGVAVWLLVTKIKYKKCKKPVVADMVQNEEDKYYE